MTELVRRSILVTCCLILCPSLLCFTLSALLVFVTSCNYSGNPEPFFPYFFVSGLICGVMGIVIGLLERTGE